MDLEDMKKHFAQFVEEQNTRAEPDFEGYSPTHMHHILYDTFGDESPITLQRLSDSDYKKIPILNQIKYVTGLIEEQGKVKLTKTGNLPTKIVADIYDQGYLKDEHIESGINKLYKETDSNSIHLTKILLDISGLTKKRHGKLSLTKSNKNILTDDYKTLKLIFETFASKFNWTYFDGYGENQIGQLGWGFTLVLLSKYGHEKRLDSFYAEKYFNAYPHLLNNVSSTRFTTVEEQAERCYSLRTFDRFLDYFGVIGIETEIHQAKYRPDSKKYIQKTDLFDKLIKVQPGTA